ncbi:MAG: helix-turn-helix transcriptional regulator [Coriobacteriales bacterium]|jgi:DNA-binding CsgD family transcriptional regulator|nr:helix-turn-helix transcriptional regulator [Coriobacteriales bacterium]
MPAQKSHGKASPFSCLASILGFGLCRAWIVFCLSILLRSSRLTDLWVFLAAGVLAALVVSLLTSRIASPLNLHCAQLHPALFRLTALVLVVGAVLIPCALWTAHPMLLLVGWLVGGVGAGLLQILWGERFAAHSSRFSLTVAPAAAILTAVMVALATSEVALIVLLIFPLVSFALLVLEVGGARFGYDVLRGRMRDARGMGGTGVVSDTARTRGFEPAVWKLMFSILAFSLICRAFDALPVEGPKLFEAFGGGVLLALIAAGGTFLILVALFKERFNVALTYRLSLPLMMTGFAVLALFVNSHAAMSLFLINMGYEFFDILSWILFAEIARRSRSRSRALRVFGLGVAFTFLGMALGYAFGDRFVGLLVNDVTQATGVVLLCMVALVLVACLVIPEGTILHLTDSLFTERKATGNSATAVVKTAEVEAEAAEAGAAEAGAAEAGVAEAGVAEAGAAVAEATEVGAAEAGATEAGTATAAVALGAEVGAPPRIGAEEADIAGEGSMRPTSIDQVCKQAASSYCLTAREGDVLILLARGRTLAIIARELSIAKGTARTHIERVYSKLGVHKQQELIDLIETFGTESQQGR